jgi:predicted DNA-binding protein
MDAKKTITIRLKAKTKERLDKLRHEGQTYDGIISEILNQIEKKIK